MRGVGYYVKGDFDNAIADFSQTIRIDPKNSRAYDSRGNSYVRKGEYDRGIADENEALRIDPKNAYAYVNRGTAYLEKGDDDQAFADYDRAILMDPKFAAGRAARGLMYSTRGDYDRALADCNEAIQLDPTDSIAWNCRGDSYGAKGEVERSVASYSEAIRLDPLDSESLTGRGLAYEKTAEAGKARADFNAAIVLAPRSNSEKMALEKARERLAVLATPPVSAAATAMSPPTPATTVVATAVAPVAVNDRRIALVIGNSAYENVPALPNPVRDAAFVAETLKRTGFESVTVLTNQRKEALITALRNFATQAEKADWAVVYYAGHGMEVSGVNYLIPTDARIAADRDIGFEAVPLEQLLNAAERAKKLRLVILDACRDNPFANQMKRTLTVASRSVSRGLAAVEPEAGTLVVYAAKDGETAIDGDGSNSPFAQAFVKNLQTPGLEVRRLFDFVRDDVMDATGRKQKPFSYGSISGRQDFYFVAGK